MKCVVMTEAERRLFERVRKEAQEAELRRRAQDETLREEHGIRVTAPWHGKHHPYAVYDGDELLCYCVYRKGAYNLMDYILKLKQTEKT